jgi:hypothetical protein
MPKPRKNLTTDWQGRKSRVSSYLCHKGQRKQLQVPQRINALMSTEIHQLFNAFVLIGSGKLLVILIDSTVAHDWVKIIYDRNSSAIESVCN